MRRTRARMVARVKADLEIICPENQCLSDEEGEDVMAARVMYCRAGPDLLKQVLKGDVEAPDELVRATARVPSPALSRLA